MPTVTANVMMAMIIPSIIRLMADTQMHRRVQRVQEKHFLQQSGWS